MTVFKTKKGLVTKKFNNFFYVDILGKNEFSENLRFLCTSRKNIYFNNQLIFVGDEVFIEEINLQNKTAIIGSLIKRRNYLERPSIANISDLYIVSSFEEPKLNLSQLNKFLINSEYLNVNVSLILTKCDLISNKDYLFYLDKFTKWGYIPRIISIHKKIGFDDFIDELRTKRCSILVGPSGVGKTTLLNQIIPNLNKATASVSNKIKRGKNTTRNIELFSLSKESYIVDTPGFNMQTINIEKKFIANLFPEFRSPMQRESGNCKFRDCLHISEPGCKLNKNFERYAFYKEIIGSSKNHYSQIQED